MHLNFDKSPTTSVGRREYFACHRKLFTNYVRSDLQKKEHRRGVFKRLQPPLENRVLLEVEVDVQNVVVRAVQVAVALVASSPTSRSSWSRPCSGFEPATYV